MTGIDASATRPGPARRRPRYTLPASRGGMAWLAVLLVVGAFVAIQVGRQVYSSWSIDQEADAIRVEISAIADQNAELQRELDYLQSNAYVAVEARKLLNLGYWGERLLIIPPGSEVQAPEPRRQQAPAKPLLQQWLDLFFGP
ncbi:MAG TPA: septum formation initiator family protein [Candidatus Limnocylindria bacterium]|nr:septum formation initiator family protein [Candidatus Limnocylindria bacterium]